MDEARLRAHLEAAYDIEVTGVASLDAEVYRVDRRDDVPWVARAFNPARPRERAEGDAAVLAFLEGAGFPAERCAHPHPVTEAGGQPVLVTTFVPGPVVEPDDDTRWALGELLGRLHTLPAPAAGAVARPAGSLHHHPGYEGGPDRDLASAAVYLANAEARVPPAGRAPFEALRAQVVAADPCADLPAALIHPDPVLKNVIATDTGLTLIDWTGAGVGPRIASLVVLLWSVAVGPGGVTVDAIDPVVGAYRGHLRPEPDELARLDAALRIRLLWLACWMYGLTMASGFAPTGREWWWPDADLADALAARARVDFDASERNVH